MKFISKKLNMRRSGGFTLVEVMVSLVIFAVVVTMAAAAILSIIDAGEKSRSLNSVMENLSTSIETMSREIRTGTNYQCPSSGYAGNSCPLNGGTPSAVNTLEFIDSGGNYVEYALNTSDNQVVEYQGDSNGLSNAVAEPITAAEVTVTGLSFYVFNQNGCTAGVPAQPYVVMDINGYVESRAQNEVSFNLQTTMSQRIIIASCSQSQS